MDSRPSFDNNYLACIHYKKLSNVGESLQKRSSQEDHYST